MSRAAVEDRNLLGFLLDGAEDSLRRTEVWDVSPPLQEIGVGRSSGESERVILEGLRPMPERVRADQQGNVAFERAFGVMRDAFPNSKIRIRLSQDPDSGEHTLSLRAIVKENTREIRERIADLAIDYAYENPEGLTLVFGVETA